MLLGREATNKQQQKHCGCSNRLRCAFRGHTKGEYLAYLPSLRQQNKKSASWNHGRVTSLDSLTKQQLWGKCLFPFPVLHFRVSSSRRSNSQGRRIYLMDVTFPSQEHGDHPWPSLMWKCKMASFVCFTHRRDRLETGHCMGSLPGGYMFNSNRRRNKMNDRQWCGNVRWRRLCPTHTGADHRVARAFRNRRPHGQPSGGHTLIKT